MACGATLKRSLEFDPLHSPSQRSPKRRRCIPMTLSPAAPPTKQHQMNPSPFGELASKFTSEQIAANIALELKRIQRRKQLQFCGSNSNPPSPGSSTSGHTSMDNSGSASPSHTNSSQFFNALSPNKKEAPLFTFRQVSLFCERMLKERELQIREEYDKVLTSKLAEQYESFLKFNHDQIQRRMTDKPASYFS